ncbi:MAG: helix-turn-helix domain-containing protein [Clostridia bacterium]|nr:helix-turn-helix domain-containing protein [Clostridia bacterium]MDY5555667.1 helix-turn-helix domain-containing protein [Blautia sp.]
MTINQRMFEIMKKKNIKSVDIANKLGISKSVISNWKSRETNPPAEYIVPICELMGVSIEFLLTGKERKDLSEEESKIIEAYRKADPAEQGVIKKILDIQENTERSYQSKTG